VKLVYFSKHSSIYKDKSRIINAFYGKEFKEDCEVVANYKLRLLFNLQSVRLPTTWKKG